MHIELISIHLSDTLKNLNQSSGFDLASPKINLLSTFLHFRI